MDAHCYVPHGRAVLDHWRGRREACVVLHCEGHETERVAASVYFRDVADFDAIEREALARCRGRVLDVGAGAGAFALPLQARGHDVVAIDVSPECVLVMRERGVRDPRPATTADVGDGPFDTVLMIMHGAGVVGTLDGLVSCLRDLHRLVAHGGRILLDSAPLDEEGGAGVAECCYVLEYEGERGVPLDWLFLGERALADRARAAGWAARIVARNRAGRYLAELRRPAGRREGTRRVPAGARRPGD